TQSEKESRIPGSRKQLPIDFFGKPLNRFFKHFVLLDSGPAGHRNLNKNEIADVFGIACEQLVDCAEPFGDSFCVIDAINPDPDQLGAYAEVVDPSLHRVPG